MNCKPGDIAVVVGGEENRGAIVEVLRPYIGTEHACEWVVLFHDELFAACDKWLRPIRPSDESIDEVRDLYAPQLPEVA